MERNNFRGDLLGKEIGYCLGTKCSKKTRCLRYLAYQQNEGFGFASFRNPRNPQVGKACSDYLSNELRQVGRGFRTAMSMVCRGQSSAIKQEVMTLLGCGRSQFYNYVSGAKTLAPEQEQALKALFSKYQACPEPFCDAYEAAYLL